MTFGRALALTLLLAGTASAGDSITFRYAPPPGTRYVEVVHTTTTTELIGVAEQSSEMTTRTAIDIARVDGVYHITNRPISAEMKRDGQPVTDPVLKALLDVVIVYRISAEGRMLAIEGFEGLEDKLGKTLPEGTFDPERIMASGTAEWNGRVGNLAGRTVSIGDVLVGNSTLPLPNGQKMEYKLHTEIARLEPCGEKSCVVIATHYQNTEAEGDVGGASILGEGERLLDPNTMLVYRETIQRTLEATGNVPGRGEVTTRSIERREYSYEYID
jgi:hypothetical protein